MKGANLSSPSVAYRHLQKLEDLGYLQKNNYGEYITKGKASVREYIWVGRRMLPKMLVYSIIFMIILIIEIVVLVIHYSVENYTFKVFFLLLTLVTGFATAVFTFEALRHRRRTMMSQINWKGHIQPRQALRNLEPQSARPSNMKSRLKVSTREGYSPQNSKCANIKEWVMGELFLFNSQNTLLHRRIQLWILRVAKQKKTS